MDLKNVETDSSMTIDELVDWSHTTAIEKGWHEERRTPGDLIALCHSELSEVLEEVRRGHGMKEIYYADAAQPVIGFDKPEGVPIELADLLMRVADMCGLYGIDLNEALRIKLAYNQTREYRHGSKVL